MEKSAKDLLKENDIVIFAHSHNPKKIEFENGIYLNTGDWVKSFSFVKIEGKKITLEFY